MNNQEWVKTFIHANPLVAKQVIEETLIDDTQAKNDVLYDWDCWARPDQQFVIPDGKDTVLILCGRGWGKTRRLSALAIELLKDPHNRIMLMAADYNNLYEGNFMGPAGIIDSLHPTVRDEIISTNRFNKQKLTLQYPDGGFIFSRSAEAFDKTRSGEANILLLDELAAWQYPEQGFDAAQAVLRSSGETKTYIATTPRPIKLIRELAKDDYVHLVKGTTYDNYFLSPQYVERLKRRFSNRLFRQECLAEILDDNPFALFMRKDIDSQRLSPSFLSKAEDKLTRIVIGVDPAGSTSANSDETGIVCGGVDNNGHGYVIEDRTIKGTPHQWGSAVVQLYHHYKANAVVVETNFGGQMVEHTLKTIDKSIYVINSHASRAKDIRAEPVAALYEQSKVSHIGYLAELEDEMCEWDPTDKTMRSPNRLDALVWALRDLMISNSSDFFVELV